MDRHEAGILTRRFTVWVARPISSFVNWRAEMQRLARASMSERCEILGHGQKSLRTCIKKCNL